MRFEKYNYCNEGIKTSISQDYHNEIKEIFLDADRQAQKETGDPNFKVDVTYIPCSKTGKDIELWREDWLIDKPTSQAPFIPNPKPDEYYI